MLCKIRILAAAKIYEIHIKVFFDSSQHMTNLLTFAAPFTQSVSLKQTCFQQSICLANQKEWKYIKLSIHTNEMDSPKDIK